ncbi:related to ADAM protease ADM-B [Melanopsichium pennsylvanicum]|uniref:Disintegrin and metalloproteinase domain-containing protein B n=2 Tax=Melanopsichium pennsylvanicum TaxID=63383 RepID=A0AAJ4XLL6_9BASI|nr:related to ADAM protease ADM-B [Melanopsichium pennsylvanicum 4]SNX84445.1 related to ADAM protease ADM-B [Melanopsichium pennsylvanicum]
MQSFIASKWLAALLLAILLAVTPVTARSRQSGLLQRIGRTSDTKLEFVSLSTSSSLGTHLQSRSSSLPQPALRLSFRAFQQNFYLHLQPNNDILHPDGTLVKYYDYNDTTGQSYVRTTETLYPGDVAAYHGVVVHPSHTSRRLEEDRAGVVRDIYQDRDFGVVGRASILLHDDGSVSGVPTFEGSFDWFGNVHHIDAPESYIAKRQSADPWIEPRYQQAGSMIVHRDSDIALESRDTPPSSNGTTMSTPSLGCSSDVLDYNTHNRLVFSSDTNDAASLSVYSFFKLPTPARLSRRDLFGGWNDLFARSVQDEVIESPQASPDAFVYHEGLDDYLEPTFRRRQATGNDIGNGGNQTNSYENVIGSTAGCPNSARVVYAGIASDCAHTERIGSQDDTRREILKNMNSVSNLYRSTFNISIGVVELDVRSGSCPSTAAQDAPWNLGCGTITIDERLSVFSQWRSQQPGNGIGLWHLMTACNSGSEIGVAWLGTVCMTDASSSSGQTVSGTGVSSLTTQQWQVMAHEIGHNFGAIHDCTNGCTSNSNYAVQNGGAPCCPLSASACNANAEYIMNPSSRANIQSFSQCSIGNVCSLIGQGLNTSCIQTPGQRSTLSTEQCGNGILEPGEECDAGPNGSQCCTSQCKLASGAQCDPSTSACCSNSCTFAPSSQMCRPSVDSRCDTAEYCTGTSAECPADTTKDDGSSCGDGLSCANGYCTSRDLQCQQASTGQISFRSACSASNANSCQLTCQSPNSRNQCLILQQPFIDGTSCGYGGRCESGECKSGSWQTTFRNLYTDNLRISIPVTIVVGIIVLALLACLLRCCFARRRARQFQTAGTRSSRTAAYNVPKPAATPGSDRSSQVAPGYIPPPPSMRQPHRASQPGWVDPTTYNGPNRF